VRNYPAHAEAITRSASAGFGGEPRTFAPQRNVDPETARPSYVAPGTSPVNEAPRGTEPAYARPAYERPATATQPAQTTGDPYARFNRGTQPANAAAPSAAAEPGTPARAPVTRTPPYRVAPAQQKKPAKHPAHPKPASDDSRGT
jgi:hypothetical protein